MVGVTLLALTVLEGFAGYSLPDDLLSGMGLVIAYGVAMSIPLLGGDLSFLIWGGEFPGSAEFFPRLYIVHVLLIPGVLLALIALHLLLIVYHKHTQWPGPGRTEKNVVGPPLMPVYMAKAGGFFFMVFGVPALMGGLLSSNPGWKYGPYDPSKGTFLQRDSYRAGAPSADLGLGIDPLTRNRYAYVNGDRSTSSNRPDTWLSGQ